MRERNRGDLTPALRRALLALLQHVSAYPSGRNWKAAGECLIAWQTFTALYERYLVRLVVDGRRQTLQLTEIGHHVARGVASDAVAIEINREGPSVVSEAASRLIAEAV